MNETEHERRERLLFAVLLLFGIAILLCVGQAAIGIAPNWEVTANMRSNLDPNSDFLTRKNSGMIEPLNSDILTLPAWLYLFTPNAILPTNAGITPPATRAPTRVPTRALTQVPTQPATLPPTIVNTVPVTSPTKKPPLPVSTSTPTNIPSILFANLAITKTDGSATYTVGSSTTYTITVSNSGPASVIGATVTDNFPAQITSATWNCAGSAVGATCTASGSGNINDSVNLPAGSSITYTVTANISGTASGNLVNTATVNVPAGYTDINGGNNTSTDADSPAVDLQITKTDGVATYTPGGTLTYTIVVTNSSTFTVNGATVTDSFPAQISSANWTCAGAGVATCTASGLNNINDTAVNLPAGLSVTYTVTANVSANAVGTLTNTASVTTPAGFTDTDLSNNSAKDPDTCTTTEPGIGPPDGGSINPGVGGYIDILFSPGIVANGDNTPDFVYYEIFSSATTIDMDWVQIEISSDGSPGSWIQVFYWGDGSPDANTNVDINPLDPINISDLCPTEIDNCVIPIGRLHNSTGVTIDIDGIVPPGNYPWMRITGPLGAADGPDIDAIQPYYP